MSVSDQREAAPHTVLFAESDAELADVAGDLLADRLTAAGVGIVIATADHRRQLEQRMQAAGVDLDRARRTGSLVVLDAAETLARLTPRGSFDKTAFDGVVGALVRSAAARAQVQAFGEMVGLLWEEGRVQEAIELEAAWDVLLEEIGASLLCAYPSVDVDSDRAHDLVAVCALHSSALDNAPFDRVWRFPAVVSTVPEARRQVIAALRARGLSGRTLEDAEVAVAELVTNAVLHGRTTFSIRVRLDGERVRVEVSDENPRFPTIRTLDSTKISGRGLHLLSALTDRWGVERAPHGKVVWTELVR